jgi:formylglycine-generating enzyme required for sulfatase activity/class 3 adenylate cyclase
MEDVTRRLAAIVMADIVGYSRLMGADERGTHQRVQRLLRELIEPTIAEHRGRLVKQHGDGFLSMFDSPVEAVRCAIVIQQSMVGRNLELPNEQAIRFRIGVNLGDVIVEPEDIYGEGVNVAARLEQLAEPGSIYISGGIYEQVRYKLVCGFQSLGDRRVKNISDPVPTYRVLPDPTSVNNVTTGRRRLWFGLAAAGVTALGIAFATGSFWHPEWHNGAMTAAAPTPSVAPNSLAVTDKPVPPPDSDHSASVGHALETAVLPPVRPQTEPPRVAPPPVTPAAPSPVAAMISEPDMVPIPGGHFLMGSNGDASEQPIHGVTVRPFLLAKYPTTVRQWQDCTRAKACEYLPSGNADAPVTNVSWDDAHQFVTWLSQATHRPYRLPTEAEWEYAARGGTETRYWWGNVMKPGFAVCKGCGNAVIPMKVGTGQSNPFGLYDISGGVAEWTDDCWVKDYRGAPADGSARRTATCDEHVLRGGSWNNSQDDIRSASRDYYDASVRYPTHGIRVARSP